MRPSESFVGQPIRSLQTMLRILGEDDPALPPLVPDGIYGPETIRAVSAFQRRYSLPVTGVTDQRTWDEIARAYEPALIRLGKAEPIEILMDPGQIYRRADRDPNLYLLQAILLLRTVILSYIKSEVIISSRSGRNSRSLHMYPYP